jgi:response regulator NasT
MCAQFRRIAFACRQHRPASANYRGFKKRLAPLTPWRESCCIKRMNPALRIVVVAPDAVPASGDADTVRLAERSRILRIALLENGFNLIAVLPADTYLRERLAQLQPDMIIVDVESEARDALEHVVMATRDERRPIVMFTNDDDSDNARHAVGAGVSAYVVAGLSSERIRPILDVAMARFAQEQSLRNELTLALRERDARTAELQERKVIDRAKGLLMQRQGLGEQQAYEKLRKSAMDKNLRLAEVAQRLLDAFELLD